MRASINLILKDKAAFGGISAPGMPPDYRGLFEGLPITPPYACPCGEAAHRGVSIVVSDVERETRYSAEWKQIMLSSGLRASRSAVITGSDGNVLATIAIHFGKPLNPNPSDPDVLEMATHLAAIALERYLTEENLKQSRDDLQLRNNELTRFNRVAVGRELRMIELKQEVNELSRQLGREAPYLLNPDGKPTRGSVENQGTRNPEQNP